MIRNYFIFCTLYYSITSECFHHGVTIAPFVSELRKPLTAARRQSYSALSPNTTPRRHQEAMEFGCEGVVLCCEASKNVPAQAMVAEGESRPKGAEPWMSI